MGYERLERCALKGKVDTPCSGRLHLHHIINKSGVGKRVVKVLRSNPPELVEWVCAGHNVGRWADTPESRAILLRIKIDKYGYEYMNDYINGLPWKVQPHEYTLEAMLA